MLQDKDSSAIVAVADLERARRFYADVLGLPLLDDGMGVLVFRTGATSLVVYASAEAGTNRANAVTWGCGADLDRIVAELEGKGVVFEHYPELEGSRLEGNVHVSGTMRLAWFKDPDGNVLHINSF